MNKIRTFRVTGPRRHFPIDMLRYDSCWPTTSEDVRLISNSFDLEEALPRRITVSLSTASPSAPTEGRWESFMWRVER